MKIFTDLKEIVRKKDEKYYKELYVLQDNVLKNIFQNKTPFYLTGGTALNRFHNLDIRISNFYGKIFSKISPGRRK